MKLKLPLCHRLLVACLPAWVKETFSCYPTSQIWDVYGTLVIPLTFCIEHAAGENGSICSLWDGHLIPLKSKNAAALEVFKLGKGRAGCNCWLSRQESNKFSWDYQRSLFQRKMFSLLLPSLSFPKIHCSSLSFLACRMKQFFHTPLMARSRGLWMTPGHKLVLILV